MFTATTTNYQTLNKSLGYTKNRTHGFIQYKNDIEMRKKRFQKRDPAPSFLSNASSNERRLVSFNDDSMDDLSSQTLLSNKATDAVIEMHSHNKLPPQWVDLYEETVEKLKRIEELQKELQTLCAKRVKIQFGDHSKLDNQINLKTQECTNILRECEENTGKISKIRGDFDESESDKKIRTNIQKSLATQISQITLDLRKQQKNLYQKIKALDAGTDVGLIDTNQEYADDDAIQEMEAMDEMAQERDGAINQLIDTINELSHIFKQLNQLVIDQGTLLDRIDYNIEQTVHQTRKANKQLKKANVGQKSGCAKKCIMILIFLNVLFSIFLYMKFRSTRVVVETQTIQTEPKGTE